MSAAPAPVDLHIHPKFLPLINEPHTIADIHGGRYGMKTETVWRLALMRAMNEPLRVLGARETLASIKDSSHKTISDIIYSAELAVSQGGPFEIQSDRIIRRDPDDPQRIISEFFYAGVRESIRDKKSLAGIDLVVFDEAGKVSQDTLDVFLPTIIRKPNCKAWFIWNPESTADPIWKWFNVGAPSNTITIETDYRDNPWLSAEALRLVEDCKRTDHEKYEHLYLGKPQSAIAGAIFGGEYKTALAEGRIGVIPYNRTKPVHTAWDLGMDTTSIWFIQAYDGHLWFIDYYANVDQEISHYLIELQRRPYVYGSMHLPHDSVNTVIHRRGIMGKNPNLAESPQSMMREAGFNVVVGPTNLKRERIDAARRKWPVCKFDHVKCADGLEGLKSYQWDRDLSDNGERKPLHNFASHPADAFMEATINVKERVKKILPVAHSGLAVADI
jgi:phage terminase large subunit